MTKITNKKTVSHQKTIDEFCKLFLVMRIPPFLKGGSSGAGRGI